VQAAQPLGATCRDGGNTLQALGEGQPWAGRVGAAEPSCVDAQHHGMALPGEVAEPAVVTAVDAAGKTAALRADSGGSVRLSYDGDAVRGGQDLHDGQAWRGQAAERTGG